MSLRTLLSVALGDTALLTVPSFLLSSWDVCAVNDLAAARRTLSDHLYPVGLLLLDNAQDSDVVEMDALLEAHQSTQWVGVIPAEKIKLPIYRALIVQHLFDFHTWPIDPFRLNHTLVSTGVEKRCFLGLMRVSIVSAKKRAWYLLHWSRVKGGP